VRPSGSKVDVEGHVEDVPDQGFGGAGEGSGKVTGVVTEQAEFIRSFGDGA